MPRRGVTTLILQPLTAKASASETEYRLTPGKGVTKSGLKAREISPILIWVVKGTSTFCGALLAIRDCLRRLHLCVRAVFVYCFLVDPLHLQRDPTPIQLLQHKFASAPSLFLYVFATTQSEFNRFRERLHVSDRHREPGFRLADDFPAARIVSYDHGSSTAESFKRNQAEDFEGPRIDNNIAVY